VSVLTLFAVWTFPKPAEPMINIQKSKEELGVGYGEDALVSFNSFDEVFADNLNID